MTITKSTDQKIIDQTNLALKFIDVVSDIIIHKKLVPVEAEKS